MAPAPRTSPGRRYHVVDVFAEKRYCGNPLTVVLDGTDLDATQMQAIARETNHSETTFVTGPSEGGRWPVRIFTPQLELPFAGHPTLGTAAVLHRVLDAPLPIVLDLPIGPIPVRHEDGLWWMTQRAPEFAATVAPETMAQALGLRPDDIDRRHPMEAASTGVPFYIVPLATLDAARRASLDYAVFRRTVPDAAPKGVLVFSTQTVSPQAALHVRVFTQAYGIPEDPATGSAAGALAAWLVRHRFLGTDDVAIAIEQGIEIGRPSRLLLRAQTDGETIGVEVGGAVVPVAEGVLLDS